VPSARFRRPDRPARSPTEPAARQLRL